MFLASYTTETRISHGACIIQLGRQLHSGQIRAAVTLPEHQEWQHQLCPVMLHCQKTFGLSHRPKKQQHPAAQRKLAELLPTLEPVRCEV